MLMVQATETKKHQNLPKILYNPFYHLLSIQMNIELLWIILKYIQLSLNAHSIIKNLLSFYSISTCVHNILLVFLFLL